MTNRLSIILASIALAASPAGAQSRPVELGVDAGVSIGLGDNSVTTINIPAQAFRVGFFIDDRTSIEPQIRINTISGSGDTFTSYLGEIGLLYHFYSSRMRPATDPAPPPRSAFYVRPFAGFTGVSGGGNSDSHGLLGAGVGMKVPMIARLASRFEANFEHIFGSGSYNGLGLLAGLSFFTR